MQTIIQKLSSRKLWISIIGLICGIILCASGDTASGSALIAFAIGGYTIPEAAVDAARLVSNRVTVSASTNSKEIVESVLNTNTGE